MKRRADGLIAFTLMVGAVAWLLAVESRQGVGRDEWQYFRSGQVYWGWFKGLGDNLKAGTLSRSFKAPGIDPIWGDNPEHPPVMKTLYGISWRVFAKYNKTIPLFESHTTAFRFPALLMSGLGVALVYFLARKWLGRSAAVAAAVMSFAIPHYFFHAQISCFDAPITVMGVAVALVYWNSLRSRAWGLAAGVTFGIALGVKHNAWLMPGFLVVHYLWMRRGDLRKWRVPRPPPVFLSMLILGPLVFLALWPRLWPDPVGRSRWYLNRHLQHEHYHFEYLGVNFKNPPTEPKYVALRLTFPFVSTFFTVPATTLLLASVGAVVLMRRGRRRGDNILPAEEELAPTPSFWRPGADVDRSPGMFLAIQTVGPMLVLAVPAAPVFGGVKHFMTGWPFLAIVAGIGLQAVVQEFQRRVAARPRLAGALPVAMAVLVCAPSVAETRRSHPDGLSHYNFFAGGFAGGASLGMNRQFWGYSIRPMIGWIARNAPPNRAVYWHDVFFSAVGMYVADHYLSAGLGDVGVGEDAVARSDLGLVVHEKHMALYEGLLMESYGTARPAFVRDREGVPIVSAYRRPGLPLAPLPVPPPPPKPATK